MREIEEKVDHLNEEFSEITVQLLEQNNNREELETEVLAKTDALKELDEGSDEYKHQQELLSQTAVTLTTKKNLVQSLELKKRSCVQRLELFRNQLQDKTAQLAQYKQEQRHATETKPKTKKNLFTKSQCMDRFTSALLQKTK